MAITKDDKEILLRAIRSIKVQDVYTNAEDDRRNWFRFGAYDMLRVVSGMIESYPESGDVESATITIVNPNEQ